MFVLVQLLIHIQTNQLFYSTQQSTMRMTNSNDCIFGGVTIPKRDNLNNIIDSLTLDLLCQINYHTRDVTNTDANFIQTNVPVVHIFLSIKYLF